MRRLVALVCLLMVGTVGVVAADEEPAPEEKQAPEEKPPEDKPPEPKAEPKAEPKGEAKGTYSPEALAVLPAEVLDQLPKLLTNFMRPHHWVALKAACPDPANVGPCLDTPAVKTQIGHFVVEGVIGSLLDRMDVELARRLSPDDFKALDELCEKQGNGWGTCVLEHGTESDKCEELEEELARCLVENDDVVELYLKISEEKKLAFGKELYVELAGFLAVLPVELVAPMRKECPQNDLAAVVGCLQQPKVAGELIGVYVELAKSIVDDAAKDITAAGNKIDTDEYTEKVLRLLLQLPSQTIVSLSRECIKKYPELDKVKSTEEADKVLQCIHDEGATDPVANPAYIAKDKLEKWVGVARAKVIEAIRKKEEEAQSKNFNRILIVLGVLAGIGTLGVLLLPVFIGKRYPGQSGLLWKASAVAAATFAIVVLLLGASLVVMRTVQGKLATDSTSPKMRVADAAFEVLAKKATIEMFSDLSKNRLDFVKRPLRDIVKLDDAEDAEKFAAFAAYLATHWADLLDEPELKSLAKNAELLKSQADSLKSVFAFYKKVDWIMGIVPIVLALLAVVLFLLPLKGMLVDIASAPARAAAAGGGGADSSKRAMTTVWAEVKSIAPFIGVMLVLLPVTGLFLALAVEPIVELLLGYTLLTVFYLIMSEASAFVLYASLGSVIFLLVLYIVAYILAMSFFLGTTRKIFRAVCHGGHRVGEFKKFWTWGTLATLWMLALPLLYVLGMKVLAGLVEPTGDGITTKDMLLIPVPALLAFPIVYWALRGLRALKFVKGYPIPKFELKGAGAAPQVRSAA